jgi:acetyl esterase/lipase
MPRLLLVRSRATPLASLEITVLTIDEELVESLGHISAATPPTPPAAGDWQARRASIDSVFASLASASSPDERVETADFSIPSYDGHALPLRMYKPPTTPNAVVVYVHGGGLIAGNLDVYDHVCRRYAAEAGVAIVAVGYRLAPESPHPAAVEDCVAAVEWATAHAKVHAPGARVAIMGDSAGGGLAAATAVICRDRGIGSLAAQILIYPMLDDRTVYATPGIDRFLAWTVADNITGWQAYLGAVFGTSDVPASASAARTESLDALPSAYLEVGQLDLFCPETVAYAQRLIAHDVPVRLSVISGAIHGFDQFAPSSRLARTAFAERVGFLRAL